MCSLACMAQQERRRAERWVKGWLLSFACVYSAFAHAERVAVDAAYIPLADHYAALVAYERYAADMEYADFRLHRMTNWDVLRAHFFEGKTNLAFAMSPLAMDMFRQQPDFRWVSLMHRDGNALAVNQVIVDALNADDDLQLHQVLESAARSQRNPLRVGLPHLKSTHAVVLYKYLQDHGLGLALSPEQDELFLGVAVAPPKAPLFLHREAVRGVPAAFEQSLPWAHVVESMGYGEAAWYSKDVLPWPNGHVECIAIAKDTLIANGEPALREVIEAIHRAGDDIEQARKEGGEALDDVVRIVQKHIPEHTREAIIASLDPELAVINYHNLNLDPAGLEFIMRLAVEGGVLDGPIDLEAFADKRFDIHLRDGAKSGH